MTPMEVRVSRRELALLCRYALVQAGLPFGYVLGGARIVMASELWFGNGLAWLAAHSQELARADTDRVQVDFAGAVVDANGQNLLLVSAIALDVATIMARRTATASVSIRNVCGGELAPAMVEAAASRGLACLVSVIDVHDSDPGPIVAAGVGAPGIDPVDLMPQSRAASRLTNIGLSVVAVGAQSTQPWPFPASTTEGAQVDFGLWTTLLDWVGGTLPPDGRGRLTTPDQAAESDAGPGAGVLHDDD